jgi:hypothetical protein
MIESIRTKELFISTAVYYYYVKSAIVLSYTELQLRSYICACGVRNLHLLHCTELFSYMVAALLYIHVDSINVVLNHIQTPM